MGENGELTFYPPHYLFQPLQVHPADRTFLRGIPHNLFAPEKDVSQFIQVRIFATHIKNGNEMERGKILLQLRGEFDSVQYFINKKQVARENSRLMRSAYCKRIGPAQPPDVFGHGCRNRNVFILRGKHLHQQLTVGSAGLSFSDRGSSAFIRNRIFIERF